jgi:hypothetical protein
MHDFAPVQIELCKRVVSHDMLNLRVTARLRVYFSPPNYHLQLHPATTTSQKPPKARQLPLFDLGTDTGRCIT